MQISNLDKGILSVLIIVSLVAAAMPPHFASAASQSENGKIVFVSNRDDPNIYDIFVMNPDGSGVTKLTNGTLSTFSALPQWSPDGTRIAFIGRPVGGGPSSQEIFVMNADGTETRQLTHVNSAIYDPQWSPDGSKIVFGSAKDASSQIYNVQIYAVNVDGNNNSGQVNLSNDDWDNISHRLSPDGTKIVFVSNRNNGTQLFVMNATDGTGVTQLTHGNNNPSTPDWSPDSTKIIFSTSVSESQISVMNADGTELRALLSKPISAADPQYSPDGTRIAFIGGRSDPAFPMHTITNLFAMNADGSELLQLTNHTGNDGGRVSWSPDSTKLVFSTQRTDHPDSEVHTVNSDGTDDTNVTNNPAADTYPDWGVQSLQVPKSILTVNAVSEDGETRRLFVTIRSGSTLVLTGYTPMTFAGNTDASYTVTMTNFQKMTFDHWNDDINNTNRSRIITLSANTTLTATYDTSAIALGFTPLTVTGKTGQPELTVNALGLRGDGTVFHMWTMVQLDNRADNGGATYTVTVQNYRDRQFDHWDDGSTSRTRTIGTSGNVVVDAYYRIS